MPTTREVLIQMFTENTGRSILDSGDAYGRNWERNQTLEFTKKPEVTFHTYDGTFEYLTVNTFEYLDKILHYNEELQEQYNNFVEDSDEPHLVDMENFVDHLEELGEDIRERQTINTYNYENVLDETLQWVEWQDRYGNTKVLLQYHGGCDARGGYTKPRVFELDSGTYLGFMYITLYCNNCYAYGDISNGGGHFEEWYNQDGPIDLENVEAHTNVNGDVICVVCNKGKLHGGIDV